MSVLFAGGELDAFLITTGTAAENTGGGGYDATYARCAIGMGSNATIDTIQYAGVTTHWLHFEFLQGTGWNGPGIIFYNAAGTQVFRIVNASSLNHQMQYWNGAAWVNIGALVNVPAARTSVDIKIVCGAGGSAAFYVNQVLQTSASASMASVTDIAKVRLGGSAGGDFRYSQVICADEQTTNWKLYLKPPTGNGSTVTWNNDWSFVDEPVLADADYLESLAAGDIELMTGAALAIGGAVAVKAVTVSARALKAAGGPQNMQLGLRSGATSSFTGNVAGLGAGMNPFQGIWHQDPNTGGGWTTASAGAAALEFGVKSVA